MSTKTITAQVSFNFQVGEILQIADLKKYFNFFEPPIKRVNMVLNMFSFACSGGTWMALCSVSKELMQHLPLSRWLYCC